MPLTLRAALEGKNDETITDYSLGDLLHALAAG
jgi:hypothetical protein